MQLYNTLARKLEAFVPIDKEGRKVTLYACGPTVYDVPHIGHARSAYVFDLLCKVLNQQGYSVNFVRNVTDVDDKIINKANQEIGSCDSTEPVSDLRQKCSEVAERYLEAYHAALKVLGIAVPDIEPRATDHVVPQMTDFIAKLIVEGAAYEVEGGVYFSVRGSAQYGKLSNRTLDELLAGFRVEPGEHKRDPMDFALWKAAKPGEPSWKSPWGEGRPGWHIECSVMSTQYLGETFDIHGGGLDLVFPHHENELAQALALGKPFARYWVHHGLLTVDGEKMSKSSGNFITVDEVLSNCEGDADVLKMFFLGVHYRRPVDYTEANLQTARGRLQGLVTFLHQAETNRGHQAAVVGTSKTKEMQELGMLEKTFKEALAEDLNTPKALAVLDSIVNCAHAWKDQARQNFMKDPESGAHLHGMIVHAADMLYRLGKALGLFLEYRPIELSDAQRERLKARESARKEKDFELADTIRKEFSDQGFLIEDTSGGPVVRPK